MPYKVRVWDLPTRVFHWSLVVCVIGLFVSGQIGGDAMDWHFRLGYATLTLLLFRLVWGLVGGYWSRFSSMHHPTSRLIHHLRGRASIEYAIGHNPLGALSVFAMLFFLLLQAGTGLISDDEIATSGPLTGLVPGRLVSLATAYHTGYGKPILIGLVLLHVAAILFYFFRKRENLVRPMLLGDKEVSQPAPSSRDDARSRMAAALLAAACAGLVALMLKLAAQG